MRYFTRSWREEYNDERAGEVIRAYHSHLDEIEPQLTPELVILARQVSLHDGLFKEFEYDVASALLRMRLRCGDLQVGYFDLRLRYEGAALVAGYTPELRSAVRDPETEILYDEVDVADDGEFAHRMLLWPRGEMDIRFRELSLSHTPVADRHDL